MGGASLYFLKPYSQNNTAFVTTIIPTPTLFQSSSEVNFTSFHWDYNPTPAFWLGWSAPGGLGVRARYFLFDQAADTASATNPPTTPPQAAISVNPPLASFLPGSTMGTAFGSPSTLINGGIQSPDQMAFGSDLRIDAVDVEATYGWQAAAWSLLASGGGRYLSLEQGYTFALSNSGGGLPISELQQLTATRKFRGGGPTVGLQANVQIGGSGVSLFGAGRGSLLVGTTHETVNGSDNIIDPTGLVLPVGGTLTTLSHGTRTSDHVLSVAELELGLEYGLALGNSTLFARAAGVNQTYFDAGNSIQSTGNLSLFGCQVSLGLNY